MKPEELMKYAEMIEVAKKQQRAKKLELNNVRVLEDKQIAKVNAPIVKALGENKDDLNELVVKPGLKAKEESSLGLQNEFMSWIDKPSTISYRFNTSGILNNAWKYVGSNRVKKLIRVLNTKNTDNVVTLETPNDTVFMLFFKNLENVGPFTDDDIDKYIALLDSKLDSNITKSLKGALVRYIDKAEAEKVKKVKKARKAPPPPPLPVVDDGDRKDGDIGMGMKKVVIRGSSGIQRGKHGNLLYNNTTLMKKLQLMLSAQEAGNDGLKKDIALFLDEALKRHLIAPYEHKHNMKIFVLSKNKRSKGNQ
jgi:hypothetical protein